MSPTIRVLHHSIFTPTRTTRHHSTVYDCHMPLTNIQHIKTVQNITNRLESLLNFFFVLFVHILFHRQPEHLTELEPNILSLGRKILAAGYWCPMKQTGNLTTLCGVSPGR